MKSDLWLAVGDETGDWDHHEQKHGFLGVALVMAKLNDWNLAEKIKAKTVQERMTNPLNNLPQQYRKSDYHHVIDV